MQRTNRISCGQTNQLRWRIINRARMVSNRAPQLSAMDVLMRAPTSSECFWQTSLGKFRVRVNFLHIIVLLQRLDQPRDRSRCFSADGRGRQRQRCHLRRRTLDTLYLDLCTASNFAGSVKISNPSASALKSSAPASNASSINASSLAASRTTMI